MKVFVKENKNSKMVVDLLNKIDMDEISPKEAYTIINSMGKGEKEILVAFIKQEIEIEEKKNSLQEV